MRVTDSFWEGEHSSSRIWVLPELPPKPTSHFCQQWQRHVAISHIGFAWLSTLQCKLQVLVVVLTPTRVFAKTKLCLHCSARWLERMPDKGMFAEYCFSFEAVSKNLCRSRMLHGDLVHHVKLFCEGMSIDCQVFKRFDSNRYRFVQMPSKGHGFKYVPNATTM